MYEQQQQTTGAEDQVAMAPDTAPLPSDVDVVDEKREPLPEPPREGGGSGNQPSDAGTTSEPHDLTNSESGLPPQGGSGGAHGECCEDCKRTCKRNFWTEVLRAVVKISTIVLAAFGIQSFGEE